MMIQMASYRHAGVLGFFALLTIVWMLPVLAHITSTIPGSGAGDNVAFVWNTWWMRGALDRAANPMWTPMLFAPWGTSLALNTHTAIPSFGAALLMQLATASPVAATNLALAATLFLNFAVTYALAFRVSGRTAPAMISAFIFGCSPYVGSRLLGHFNLLSVWVLPLIVLVTARTLDSPSRSRIVIAGVSYGASAYVDYYYAVYGAALVVLIAIGRSVRLSTARRALALWQRSALRMIVGLLLVDIGVLIVITFWGGGSVRVAGIPMSMRSIDNPLAIAELLLLIGVACYVVPRLKTDVSVPSAYHDIRTLGLAAIVAVVVMSPLVIAIGRLWAAGDYSSQRYFWRSAPAGVDLATLLLGNPNSLLTGWMSTRAYDFLGIDRIEQVGWLGPAVIALGTVAVAQRPSCPVIRTWIVAGLFFLVWAIGPYLVLAGHHVWTILPATIVRYIPVLSNARIPARAIVVVYLACAILAGIGWECLRAQSRQALRSVLLILLLADYVPAPTPVFLIDQPAIYAILRDQPDKGIVCELPMGIRDGFGELGRLDMRSMLYQVIHDRPIAGGFVARLSPRIKLAYTQDPAWAALLELSDGSSLSVVRLDSHSAASRLFEEGVRHLVVNRLRASPDLLAYVSSMDLAEVATTDERTLYRLDKRRDH